MLLASAFEEGSVPKTLSQSDEVIPNPLSWILKWWFKWYFCRKPGKDD